GAPELDHLAGRLKFFLFPLRFRPQEGLFDLCLLSHSAIQLDFELFLYRLSRPHRVRGTFNCFRDGAFETVDLGEKLGSLGLPFFLGRFEFFVRWFLKFCEDVWVHRWLCPLACVSALSSRGRPGVCQRIFQFIDFSLHTAPLRTPSLRLFLHIILLPSQCVLIHAWHYNSRSKRETLSKFEILQLTNLLGKLRLQLHPALTRLRHAHVKLSRDGKSCVLGLARESFSVFMI